VTGRGFAVLVLLTTACARPKPEPATPPRIPDSAPEQSAALNYAARLGLEAEEQRWGIEAAKERKRQADEEAESRKKTAVIPMPAPNDSDGGSADGGPR
jgi:hypothetical protein